MTIIHKRISIHSDLHEHIFPGHDSNASERQAPRIMPEDNIPGNIIRMLYAISANVRTNVEMHSAALPLENINV
jgi:hypothetical protein